MSGSCRPASGHRRGGGADPARRLGRAQGRLAVAAGSRRARPARTARRGQGADGRDGGPRTRADGGAQRRSAAPLRVGRRSPSSACEQPIGAIVVRVQPQRRDRCRVLLRELLAPLSAILERETLLASSAASERMLLAGQRAATDPARLRPPRRAPAGAAAPRRGPGPVPRSARDRAGGPARQGAARRPARRPRRAARGARAGTAPHLVLGALPACSPAVPSATRSSDLLAGVSGAQPESSPSSACEGELDEHLDLPADGRC